MSYLPISLPMIIVRLPANASGGLRTAKGLSSGISRNFLKFSGQRRSGAVSSLADTLSATHLHHPFHSQHLLSLGNGLMRLGSITHVLILIM